MSLENDIRDGLTVIPSLARGGKYAIYPTVFPQIATPVWPAVRYTFVSVVPNSDICGDGDDNTSDQRVQFDLVASTYDGMRSLRLDVMAVFAMFYPPAQLELTQDEYDSETKTHRATLDYVFHGSSDPSGSPP